MSEFPKLGIRSRVELVQRTYTYDDRPWVIAYSGGKDSTAVLQLIWLSLSSLPKQKVRKPIYVCFVDTGMEHPAYDRCVQGTLSQIAQAAKQQDLPVHVRILEPELKHRYFICVIGRGYAPPTHWFRWCTKDLRIQPMSRFIRTQVSLSEEVVVVLGLRKAESQGTGFAIASMILGWAYYSFEVTHIVDRKTFNGMASVRANITRRLTSPFRSDPELRDKLDRLEWRTVKRVFFQFIDETPSLKTSNELAFLSGLAFYSFIDVACISAFFLFIAICGWLFAGGAPLAVKIYAATLTVSILLAIGAAKTSIKKHTETSNFQLDAILSDHIDQLRERFVRSPTIE